jgi:SecD/SecF fusion protein
MSRFTFRILVCLVPTLLSIAVVARAGWLFAEGRGGFALGVDLVGGSVLVYEIDPTKSDQTFEKTDLAAALKRRIDPADLYNITIRPIGNTRVEIILPTGGQFQAQARERAWQRLLEQAAKKYPVEGEESPYANIESGEQGQANLVDAIAKHYPNESRIDIQDWIERQLGTSSSGRKTLTENDVVRIKSLIERQGRLEFRILANREDDGEAIQAAQKYFEKLGPAELEKFNIRAEPPPPPRGEDGSDTFPVKLTNEPNHSYSWIELDKQQVYSLRLNNAALSPDNAENDADRQAREQRRAEIEAREKDGKPFFLPGYDNLFYVRKITDWSRRNEKERAQGKVREFFVLVRNPLRGQEITGDYVIGAFEQIDQQGRRAIGFRFNAEGGNRFYDVTNRNKPTGGSERGYKRQLAIIFDGRVVSAPNLITAIRNEGQITGEFTANEVSEMVRILRAGALPATLKKDPVSENSMGATLGADTIFRGSLSVVGAFVAVLAFMVWYYRFAGLVACFALFTNLIMTVAFMVLVQAAFTLPGLAGLVLTLGMAVDANILIYERLREERDRGASLAMGLRNGYERAFPTILDTHLSSIFTAIVLYVVGNDQLKGFGISLTVGLVISLFTSLYITRTIFEIGFAKGWITRLNFFQPLADLIHRNYFDFMSVRHVFFSITLALTILGGALFIYRADSDPNTKKATVLNIDFTGGTAYTGRLEEPMSIEELRKDLQDGLPDMSIEQRFVRGDDSPAGKSRYFTVRTSARDPEFVLKYISEKLSGKLSQVKMKTPELLLDNAGKATGAKLAFVDTSNNQGFVSVAQIQRLIGDELQERKLNNVLFNLDKPEEASLKKGETFAALTLKFTDPIDAKEARAILTAVQDKMAASPQPESLEVFDSQLAASTQLRALYAILASWGAILLYLWFRFGNWTFGLSAVLCLIHDVFFTLGAIALCHYIHQYLPLLANVLLIQDFKIDLPAIAALLTLVGYSVNDTIVVFDRIREVRGKSPNLTLKMINDSCNQTLTRTLLASAAVFLVVLVLYVFGGEGVKLFAFVMIIGVIVGTYSSIFVASPLLILLGEGRGHPSQTERAVTATTKE